MRNLSIALILLFLCSAVCGCDSKNRVYVEGIENFKPTEGYYEINAHILPSEGFVDMYPYSTAQYNHKQLFNSIFSITETECSLIVIHYDATQYINAKTYCLQNMDLINTFQYNDYMFSENIRLAIAQDRVDDGKVMYSPEWFNMFAYSDTKRCLIFMGAYIHEGIDENAKTDSGAWAQFVQLYFSDFYSF